MIRGFKSGIILMLLITQAQLGKGQYVLKEADVQYNLYNYSKAIKLYTEAFNKKGSLHAIKRLADSYRLVQDYQKAEYWYAMLITTKDSKPHELLQYAEILRQNSKYEEAKTQFIKYKQLVNVSLENDKSNLVQGCDSALKWLKNPGTTVIYNEKTLNSSTSDWGVVKLNHGIVFASDRMKHGVGARRDNNAGSLNWGGLKLPDKNIYGWTENGYLKLFIKNGDDDSLSVFSISKELNYHIGNASFTENEAEFFFSATRISEPTKQKEGLGTINIELYSSRKDSSGNWAKPVSFRYNDVNSYSVGDPLISKDGKMLYFVSSMPGGLGGTDIYVCRRKSNGDWDLPQNMKVLNSPGNERTPYIDDDYNFYFSSDGLTGMGGLDIYRSKLISGVYTVPENLGYPVNSPQDDFSYIKISETTGYLSSNRFGGFGSDDIYSFAERPIAVYTLTGIVYNKKTNDAIENATVVLEKQGGQNIVALTDTGGHFKFDLQKGSNYRLKVGKTNFTDDMTTLSTDQSAMSMEFKRDLYLGPDDMKVKFEIIKLKSIYYDFNKADIRADAAIELNKLIKFLKDRPSISGELGSHTDSRGNDEFNGYLSQKRANSAVQYMIDRGIDKARIKARGYGETQLVNKCGNGMHCTEVKHQLNRRTEFKIVK